MATQLYVMPITGTGAVGDPRRPKYADTDLAGVAWAAMDFGNQPIMLVATATNAALGAEVDVLTVPLNLDQNLSAGAVTTVQNYLEAHFMPADWVSTAYTYRQVVRYVACAFQIFQRCQGMGLAQLMDGSSVTLSTTFASLPANVRTILLNAAVSLNFDTSSLSGASTLRQIIKALMVQFAGPIQILDITI
jgi:hypothetical protein